MKFLSTLAAAAAVLAITTPAAHAITQTCTNPGNPSTTYMLTDAVDAECFDGNDTPLIDGSFSVFGMTGWVLADKNDDNTSGTQDIVFTTAPGNGSQGGTWAISSFSGASHVMVNLKSGNSWGSFLVDVASGTWTVSRDLSHASIYFINGSADSVPLPAAALLFGTALIGGAAARRKAKRA